MARSQGVKGAKERYRSAEEIAEIITKDAPGNRAAMVRSEKKGKMVSGEAPNKIKMGLTDMGASVFAQGFNEGWSWLMRQAGAWSNDGFLATQNDMLQAGVPAMGGLIWYLVELYGVGKTPPGAFKVGRLEAAKLLYNLGLQKFWMALRSRSSESKKALENARLEAQEHLAKQKDAEEKLLALQQRVRDLERGGGK
jgi:hypothetical protein